MTTATDRASRYNPTLRRHSWVKGQVHHKHCRWCRIRLRNEPVPGTRESRWYQIWWQADGTIGWTMYGDPIPKCTGPDVGAPTTAMPEKANSSL